MAHNQSTAINISNELTLNLDASEAIVLFTAIAARSYDKAMTRNARISAAMIADQLADFALRQRCNEANDITLSHAA